MKISKQELPLILYLYVDYYLSLIIGDYMVCCWNRPWTAIDEAWDEFLKIEIGITKFGELKKENKVLLDQFATHDDIIKNIRKVVAKIRALLRAFNGVLEEKSKSTETTTATDHQSHRLSTTATGHHSQRASVTAPAGTHPVNNNNLSVPADRELLRKIKSLEAGRDELIEKLHVIRIQALEQKKLVNSRKQDCENEFKNFCAVSRNSRISYAIVR